MDLQAFRELCEKESATDQAIIAAIMVEKRNSNVSPDEKDKICSILRETGHTELAEKFSRNRERHRSRNS